MYDYLIVGAGLFGATFAHEMTAKGKKCLVVDKRKHIGGNCYTEKWDEITVHKYGPHIFHTDSKKIWDYVNQFAEFNRFTNAPVAYNDGKIYNLPFNMNTFYQLWGTVFPLAAKQKIESQRVPNKNPKNLEEKALDLVGRDIYEILVKGYTEKQWGRPCTELSPDIIGRLPLRFTYDNSYYNDLYQGVPIGGYTPIIQQLLKGSTVILGVDYLENKKTLDNEAKRIVYTGMVDELFQYKYGQLQYRSLEFKESIHICSNYQGNAVVNYTGSEYPYTRIIEHKHFEGVQNQMTVVTKEYPKKFEKGDIPYYPVNNKVTAETYALYKEEAAKAGIILGGRVGMYSYFDMDDTIEQAFKLVDELSV